MKYQYKVTVEKKNNENDLQAPSEAMRFEVENHDDIFAIVKRLQTREDFTHEEAQAFGVGLKLFSEVMLKNKHLPLFSSFIPHFVDFMKELKKG